MLCETDAEARIRKICLPGTISFSYLNFEKAARWPPVDHILTMRKLQGGDWGSSIVRYMALNHANAVLAIHINMFLALPPNATKAPEKFHRFQGGQYSEQEKKNLERTEWFATVEVCQVTTRIMNEIFHGKNKLTLV